MYVVRIFEIIEVHDIIMIIRKLNPYRLNCCVFFFISVKYMIYPNSILASGITIVFKRLSTWWYAASARGYQLKRVVVCLKPSPN